MSSANQSTIVDNEVYNVIKVLAVKLEGLSAYNAYQQDGQATDSIWQQLRRQDEQSVEHLLQQLETFAQEGKLAVRRTLSGEEEELAGSMPF